MDILLGGPDNSVVPWKRSNGIIENKPIFNN